MKGFTRCNFLISLIGVFGGLYMQNVAAIDHDEVMTSLGNATYIGIEDHPVTLADGRWEGAPYVEGGSARPAVGLVKNILMEADLDADGSDEIVVVLWQTSGGTGSNMYLAVMKPETGSYLNSATALIGDRVKIRAARIEAGAIVLDVLQAGENDPMCCPTMLATRRWVLNGGQLEEMEMQKTGPLSLATLDETEWRLIRMDPVQELPEDAEVTLNFGGGRVSGKSACNRYSADVRQGERPGTIIIGPAMVTRMACAEPLMEIESRYLAMLSEVESFSFQAGSLALSGQSDDGVLFIMLFSAQGADKP